MSQCVLAVGAVSAVGILTERSAVYGDACHFPRAAKLAAIYTYEGVHTVSAKYPKRHHVHCLPCILCSHFYNQRGVACITLNS